MRQTANNQNTKRTHLFALCSPHGPASHSLAPRLIIGTMPASVRHLHTYFLFPFSIDQEAVREADAAVWEKATLAPFASVAGEERAKLLC